MSSTLGGLTARLSRTRQLLYGSRKELLNLARHLFCLEGGRGAQASAHEILNHQKFFLSILTFCEILHSVDPEVPYWA